MFVSCGKLRHRVYLMVLGFGPRCGRCACYKFFALISVLCVVAKKNSRERTGR